MAKLSAGFLGPFSGRMGTGVGYMWNGKCCVRSYQKFVKNPRTEAQQEWRSLFKQEVQLAAQMKMVVNETMTDLAREAGMTAYNLFVKGNQHAFFLGRRAESAEVVLGVDYPNLRLSMGDVPVVESEDMTLDDDNVLTVRFSRGTGRGLDRVYLYVFVPDLGEGFLTTPVYRREKQITLALPDDYVGHEFHAWLMVKGEFGGWSESTYCAVPAGFQVEESKSLKVEESKSQKVEESKSQKVKKSKSLNVKESKSRNAGKDFG